jgi:hypothetical protein
MNRMFNGPPGDGAALIDQAEVDRIALLLPSDKSLESKFPEVPIRHVRSNPGYYGFSRDVYPVRFPFPRKLEAFIYVPDQTVYPPQLASNYKLVYTRNSDSKEEDDRPKMVVSKDDLYPLNYVPLAVKTVQNTWRKFTPAMQIIQNLPFIGHTRFFSVDSFGRRKHALSSFLETHGMLNKKANSSRRNRKRRESTRKNRRRRL